MDLFKEIKSNRAWKTADFHQISKLRYVRWCVARENVCPCLEGISLALDASRSLLTSPLPKALFPQCPCNKNPFRPVWGKCATDQQGSGKSLYLMLKGARWGGLFQQPNISVPLWSAFLLIHMQLLPRVSSRWTEGSRGKRSLQFQTICELFEEMLVSFFIESNIFISWVFWRCFRGSVFVSLCYLLRGSLELMRGKFPEGPHPSPGGCKQRIWSNLPEVSLRDWERWTPIYHH